MKIDLYTVSWNEAAILPFFLKHYERFVDRIVVYDNGSSDATPQLIDAHPLCERRDFDTGGQIRDDLLLKLKNSVWQESRGRADWVIVCDVDEFIYHPDLLAYLADCQERGVTILQPHGFTMFAAEAPSPERQIWEQIKTGRPDRFYSKRALFKPDKVKEINYQHGCHTCAPVGQIKVEKNPALKLLHYKYIGSLAELEARWNHYGQRMSQFNKSFGMGAHYTQAAEAATRYERERRAAKPIDLDDHPGSSRPTPKRILFMAEAITLSHVVRPMVLAQALAAAGYEVFIACDPRYNALLAEPPFEIIPLKTLSVAQIQEKLQKGFPLFDVDVLNRYVQEDLKIFSQVSPDVVVGDMRQSLAVSSKLIDLPYINMINAHWSPYARQNLELVDPPLRNTVVEPLAQLIFALTRPVGSAVHALPLNAVRLKYGLPLIGFDLKQVYAYGDYTVYPDVPDIIPTFHRPANHIYLGPILWSPQLDLPEWWDQVPNDRATIYVNLGSSGQPKLLALILNSLAELPVYVIAATAARIKIDSLPANVYLADFLPGFEAAQRAQLVICNGGTTSVQQSLAAGTPVLSIVSNIDQLIFAKAVQEIGAGKLLREQEVNRAVLKEQVVKILARNSYRLAAGKIAQVFKNFDAPETFMALVEAIKVN